MYSWFIGVTAILTVATALAGVSQAESLDARGELETCARMTDRDRRIDCYEQLGQRVLQNATDSAAPAAALAADLGATAAPDSAGSREPARPSAPDARETAGAKPLPDTLGGAAFETPDETAAKRFVGRLTACERGRDDRWVFYFDNGQIWKQSDYKRARYPDCDTAATITKDGFGYKLAIDGNSRTVRVSRRK